MDVSENEIGLREARAQIGEIANRAHLTGQVTYLMRNGRRIAAVVPVNRVAKESTMTITVTDLAQELNVSRDDVLALADQLTTLDSSEDVVDSEDRYEVTLTAEAAAVIRDQLSS